jgi:hypothetical protein
LERLSCNDSTTFSNPSPREDNTMFTFMFRLIDTHLTSVQELGPPRSMIRVGNVRSEALDALTKGSARQDRRANIWDLFFFWCEPFISQTETVVLQNVVSSYFLAYGKEM